MATPMCKFCEGSGEPKSVYSSHWQFSKPVNGNLTCPKLLNYKCKTCGSKGHIEKRCQIKKNKQESNFCRFCFNMGNDEYTQHNQFDKGGFVVCPRLLEIKCQQCGLNGHTRRYCGTSAAVQTSAAQAVQAVQTAVKTAVKTAVNTNNKFASLFVEEPEEQGANEVVKEDVKIVNNDKQYPTLLSTTSTKTETVLSGWAKMASLPKKTLVTKEPVPVQAQVPVQVPDDDFYEEVSDTGYHYFESITNKPGSSWADDEDNY